MPLPAEINDIRNKLRKAAIDCSSRGIIYASKWAAEMLDNLVKEDDIDGSNSSLFGPTNTFGQAKASSGATIDDNNDSDDDDIQKRQDMLEEDKYLLAKAYFDSREYERAAKCIEKCTGPRAWFLRIYSQYLSGEKRMKEALAEFKDNHERPNIVNDVLKDIMNELEQNKEHLDGFGLYLLGTIYAKQKSKKARDVLLESVQMYPHNWSAWLTLASCLDTRDLVENITPKLPQGIMRHFFLAHTTIETPPSNTPSTDLFSVHYNIVKQMFPKSPFVISMQAMRHYHCREFEEADSVFLELEEQDPYYIDHADIHSNILYVMEDRPQLGALAHRCSSIDMFRPETCCVVGRYIINRALHHSIVN
ncbi:Anaphase-promoting complex subunit 8 [Mycoemilia scoparia]|uniref:Anaphase-promoting complex subunit 8 n=1 Tax=Mycoemilia scoparia TaxID=417184 RepID=A0A9W7ZUH8_9FUNG|nr:Anaphase-promoting complex subunit 8 [Mycoemilia scoparia]